MSQSLPELQADLLLKYPESDPADGDPWKDDVLNRKKIAEKLTNIIRNQSESIVIGLHGDWGTGKTFLLKRWKCDLEGKGAKAIYFNAWEDDFFSDPFTAIIGQLTRFFRENNIGYDDDIKNFEKIAMSFIINNAKNILEKHTGIIIPDKIDENGKLNDYIKQIEERKQIREQLSKLSSQNSIYKNEESKEKIPYPLIFIIDELDRCRPTFAIELLENVKHIFDVDNVVFVFGLNRNELCNSIKSIYGNINANTYLRRFFDLELNIPEPDHNAFYLDRIKKQKVISFFRGIVNVATNDRFQIDFNDFGKCFACISENANLSLRDIEHCIKMTIFAAKNMDTDSYLSPTLLSVMVLLRLKKPNLYRNFVNGECLGCEIVDYLDRLFFKNTIQDQDIPDSIKKMFYLVEAELYLSSENTAYNPRYHMSDEHTPYVLKELSDLLDRIEDTSVNASAEVHDFKYLSQRTKNSTNKIKINFLISYINSQDRPYISRKIVEHVAGLIDLYQKI